MARRPRPHPFARARKAEAGFARQLARVARHIADLVRAIAPDGDPDDVPPLVDALRRYENAIQPWADAAARRMVADVDRRDRAAWMEHAQALGEGLRREIAAAPTGTVMRRLQAEAAGHIASLPRAAAERVQRLAARAVADGTRADELAAEIARTGQVAAGRARAIAFTETGRAITALTRARAEHVGSPGYRWTSSQDQQVRPSHRKMNGVFVKWSDPPTLDKLRGHAGALPRCRCICLPVLPPD